tara:strand:+ start:415 stop:894 length:480 start_codon:yes stop_codon:yes gene_type:complete
MNYCSIEDAWGNNFNTKYYEFEDNNIVKFDTIEKIKQNETNEINEINKTPENSNQKGGLKKAKQNKAKHIEKQKRKTQIIEKKINELNKLKKRVETRKKYLALKKQALKKNHNKHIEKKYIEDKNKITGGGFEINICDKYILLGLVLLFIIDYFGNLSY